MIKLKCFIASAFGKHDIDNLYKNAFERVLKSLNIEPNRVDIIEHNEDIDDKIIELIHSCDFCIADLTYARPSVYYEAGYFTGLKKPVIFTARKDHFIPNPNDINGNNRVHFDLQMKNIIQWSSTDNVKTFNGKLERRINHILEPIKKENKEIELKQAQRGKFKRLSQVNKIKELNESLIVNLKSRGWQKINYDTNAILKPDDYLAYKNDNKVIAYFDTNSATKEFLKYITKDRIIRQILESNQISGISCHIIILSIRKIPISRIDDYYPEHELINENGNTYYAGDIENNKCYFNFIFDIHSKYEFELILEEKLNEIAKL